jgi:signal transduction histidine kinase
MREIEDSKRLLREQIEELKGRIEHLEAEEKGRRERFYTILHDVRAPLTVIKSNSSLLVEKYDALLSRPAQMRELAEAIDEAAGRLQERLDELLRLFKPEGEG